MIKMYCSMEYTEMDGYSLCKTKQKILVYKIEFKHMHLEHKTRCLPTKRGPYVPDYVS